MNTETTDYITIPETSPWYPIISDPDACKEMSDWLGECLDRMRQGESWQSIIEEDL